jgi:pyruvate/2-oxoglutarate dehydrogenase complex dihydrolipoamide dehydrogenase (E3) component
MGPPPNGLAGAAISLVAIFLPGILVLVAALPFWETFRKRANAQAVMRGVNAAVVGLLGAALYNPVWTTSVNGPGDFGVALVGFVLLTAWEAPPLVAVAVSAIGTCVNTGCTPTKTLVASAFAAFLARRASDYGVTIGGPVGVDMQAVKARKDAIAGASRRGVERSLKTLEGCTVYEGHARFVADKKVAVNGSVLEANRIFINVGGRASIPPIPGLDQVPHFTNSSMMDIDFLPSHLIILGGSYIGLEFAQVYRRFGSEVTVIELAPRLIPREDEDVSSAVAEFLKEEGIDVRVGSKVVGVEKQGNSIAVKVESAGKISQVIGTHVLVAIGRGPNTDDLGLDKAGIAIDPHGYIQVDDQLRTNVPGIWAMGDCNGRGAFTHTSWNDFEIVAANILDNDQRRVSDRISAYALYTDPPLGRVGMTEAEVRKTGGELKPLQ